MNQRILVLILLIAAVAFGIFWMTSSDPRGDIEQMGDDMPTLEMGTGTTTVPVPTDMDVEMREGQIGDRAIEYPAVDVETEDREIEYPTVDVVPAEEEPAIDIDPVMEEPNDPVPPVDVDVDEDGNVTATQPAE